MSILRSLLLLAVLLALAGCERIFGPAPEPPPPIPTYDLLIPAPVSARMEADTFHLRSNARIHLRPASAEVRGVAELLAARLRAGTGFALPLAGAGAPAPGDLVLALDGDPAELGSEGYRLRVDPQRVTLSAADAAGLFRGAQTLRQLLPWTLERGRPQRHGWGIRAGTITDHPRFAWRGAMLDVARNFFSVDEVERYIDLLAHYKINRFHLHLTDDQGWRLEIRSWPRLAEVGGRTRVGGGPGGYYTQAQFAALAAYAARRHVVLVPEIEMPAHVNAALVAYPELACDGAPTAPHVGAEPVLRTLCLDSELARRWVEDVVREVAALTPGPYLHIGGDEAYTADPEAYARFMAHAQRVVRAHGKIPIGWEELARAPLRPGVLVQHWRDPELAARAAAQGARLVLSPAARTYLDMKYDAASRWGTDWAGLLDVRTAYRWDPAALLPGVPEPVLLGVEAPLWTEGFAAREVLDWLAFPRVIGLAEIGWSPQRARRWEDYRRRLGRHGPRLEAMGVGFHRSPLVEWERR